MIAHAPVADHTDHDTVMNWLQNRELKDRKLGAARSRFAKSLDISTTIDRMGDILQQEFPSIDRDVLDQLVREYVDPMNRVQAVAK